MCFSCFKIILTIWDSLPFHVNFIINTSISDLKNWKFNRNCIAFVNQLGKYCHVNTIKSSSP